MTTAQVVETSVTVNNNSPIQDYVHPDDQTQPKKGEVVQSFNIIVCPWPFLKWPNLKCQVRHMTHFD